MLVIRLCLIPHTCKVMKKQLNKKQYYQNFTGFVSFPDSYVIRVEVSRLVFRFAGKISTFDTGFILKLGFSAKCIPVRICLEFEYFCSLVYVP